VQESGEGARVRRVAGKMHQMRTERAEQPVSSPSLLPAPPLRRSPARTLFESRVPAGAIRVPDAVRRREAGREEGRKDERVRRGRNPRARELRDGAAAYYRRDMRLAEARRGGTERESAGEDGGGGREQTRAHARARDCPPLL